MIYTQEQLADTVPIQPVAQFQTLSPIALRHYMAELNRTQDDLKERLRQQEQATRNAVGVGVLSVVLAATSIVITVCLRGPELRSPPSLVARSTTSSSAVMLTLP